MVTLIWKAWGGIQIYEFDGSKAEEALWDISQPYTKFYDIPGYRYELKLALKAREANAKIPRIYVMSGIAVSSYPR